MRLTVSKFFQRLSVRKEEDESRCFLPQNFMDDLDAAAKTTILHKLKLGKLSLLPSLRSLSSLLRSSFARVSGHVLDEPDLDKEFMEEMHIICGLARKGFNVESVVARNISFLSGMLEAKARSNRCGRHYFQNAQGLVFVVDSNDQDRVVEAYDKLHRMLNEIASKHFCHYWRRPFRVIRLAF